ncbi:hypothetical protein [Loktanella sp. IMCC34160]|uniref:hypothetical protein n=1 Tax=Loktanella sp. IMCC34160 TaxID=2510646 RepID=UPI0013EB2277|nr:hypothetical protein [Loktanella sp. IMCC34160]
MPIDLDPDAVDDPQHFSPFGIPAAMMDLLFGELDEAGEVDSPCANQTGEEMTK